MSAKIEKVQVRIRYSYSAVEENCTLARHGLGERPAEAPGQRTRLKDYFGLITRELEGATFCFLFFCLFRQPPSSEAGR